MSSGTCTLHLSLRALNIKNDLVLSSPLSFVAGANAALYCEAKIDFVDINFKDYNIDIDKLEKLKNILKKQKSKLLLLQIMLGNLQIGKS